jgi:hypothetical protein
MNKIFCFTQILQLPKMYGRKALALSVVKRLSDYKNLAH